MSMSDDMNLLRLHMKDTETYLCPHLVMYQDKPCLATTSYMSIENEGGILIFSVPYTLVVYNDNVVIQKHPEIETVEEMIQVTDAKTISYEEQHKRLDIYMQALEQLQKAIVTDAPTAEYVQAARESFLKLVSKSALEIYRRYNKAFVTLLNL